MARALFYCCGWCEFDAWNWHKFVRLTDLTPCKSLAVIPERVRCCWGRPKTVNLSLLLPSEHKQRRYKPSIALHQLCSNPPLVSLQDLFCNSEQHLWLFFCDWSWKQHEASLFVWKQTQQTKDIMWFISIQFEHRWKNSHFIYLKNRTTNTRRSAAYKQNSFNGSTSVLNDSFH